MTYPLAQVAAPFIAPALAAAGVAMVAIPVAIHLLSRWRRRPEPWGAMRFLLEAYRKQKRRMHLEQWLLLLLRSLIVLVLGLALARPMLVGALGAFLGGLDQRDRVIHLVIDTSLSHHARDMPDATRFDRLVANAEAVLDVLGPGDRVLVWSAGRPSEKLFESPTPDHTAARQALQRLHPGFGRSGLDDVVKTIRDLTEQPQFADTQTVTFLFSDFARATSYTDTTDVTQLAVNTPDHRLVVSRPLPSATNLQLQSVNPRRHTLWVGGGGDQTLPLEVQLSRFTDDTGPASVVLHVELIDNQGKALVSTRKTISFRPGQNHLRRGLDLPIGPSPAWLSNEAGSRLTLRARVESDNDAISVDNQALSVIELRSQMRVAVVDEPVNVLSQQDQGLSPGQWVTLALNPETSASSGPIEPRRVTPEQLHSPGVLQTFDAVLLIRPDRLSRPGWEALGHFVNAGGLAWVITPAYEGASPWVSQLNSVFNTGWRIGLESVGVDENTPLRRIAAGPLKAEPLEQLTPDWESLTRPLRIARYLPVEADEADTWVRLDDGQHALIAHHQAGRGSLLLLSTAVDTRWTNLPTKPMFVPLIHETLRGVLGTRRDPSVVEAIAGDLPALDEAWQGATAFKRLTIADHSTQTEPGDLNSVNPIPRLAIRSGQTTLSAPVAWPGVYLADADNGPCRMIVNPDPSAGDARQADEGRLTSWLNAQGDWAWLDEQNPGAVLERPAETTHIGWPLLWGVLGLLLVESWVARRFSHAGAGRGGSLTTQLWRGFVRFRSGGRADRSTGRAA